MKTPRHVIDFIAIELTRKQPKTTPHFPVKIWAREEIAASIKRITLDHLGIGEERYHEDADFIRDFGAD